MKTLNLGAGNRIDPQAVNHDLTKHRPEIAVAWDLNVFPWPWQADEFDVINAWAVLEHLSADRLAIFNELWRILKPGGLLALKLPAWNSERAHEDLTHYWYVTPRSLDSLDPRTELGKAHFFYTPRKWQIVKVKWTSAGKSSLYFRLQKVVNG